MIGQKEKETMLPTLPGSNEPAWDGMGRNGTVLGVVPRRIIIVSHSFISIYNIYAQMALGKPSHFWGTWHSALDGRISKHSGAHGGHSGLRDGHSGLRGD